MNPRTRVILFLFVLISLSLGVFGYFSSITSFLDCVGHTPDSFRCHATYYRAVAMRSGAPHAITELKNRMNYDLYTDRECHLLMHEIGRSIVPRTTSITEMFADGDYFCDGGYYHGVMEGLIQKQGTMELSSDFLNGLCSPFRDDPRHSASHQNCSHGLGHGIMYVNSNELFNALKTCNLLEDGTERNFCWGGVFMENVITDFRDHTTKYLKPEDLMYPCNVVEETYKSACYYYQSAYVLKVTKSFEKTFAACREVPNQYREICFLSIGRDALVDIFPEDLPHTKKNCLVGKEGMEQENCVTTVVRILISNSSSNKRAKEFCSLLENSLRDSCFATEERYYQFFISQNKSLSKAP